MHASRLLCGTDRSGRPRAGHVSRRPSCGARSSRLPTGYAYRCRSVKVQCTFRWSLRPRSCWRRSPRLVPKARSRTYPGCRRMSCTTPTKMASSTRLNPDVGATEEWTAAETVRQNQEDERHAVSGERRHRYRIGRPERARSRTVGRPLSGTEQTPNAYRHIASRGSVGAAAGERRPLALVAMVVTRAGAWHRRHRRHRNDVTPSPPAPQVGNRSEFFEGAPPVEGGDDAEGGGEGHGQQPGEGDVGGCL